MFWRCGWKGGGNSYLCPHLATVETPPTWAGVVLSLHSPQELGLGCFLGLSLPPSSRVSELRLQFSLERHRCRSDTTRQAGDQARARTRPERSQPRSLPAARAAPSWLTHLPAHQEDTDSGRRVGHRPAGELVSGSLWGPGDTAGLVGGSLSDSIYQVGEVPPGPLRVPGFALAGVSPRVREMRQSEELVGTRTLHSAK